MNRAREALDRVQSDPAAALALAEGLLDEPGLPPSDRAAALWAAGRACAELDRLEPAEAALLDALKLATDEALPELAAEIRLSLSGCKLAAGDTDAARRLLDDAERHIVGHGSQGRLSIQRGLVDLHTGRLETAVAHFDRAEAKLPAGVDDLARMRLLVNRGVALTMTGTYDRAEADLQAGQRVAERRSQHLVSAGAAQNLGFVAGRKGNVPAALAWFDKANAGYEAVGSPQRALVVLEADRCAVLLAAGLYAEAATAARRSATMAANGGNRLNEAEALLLLARVRLADGSFASAEEHALAAAGLFQQSQREVWAAMADYIALQAAVRRSLRPDRQLLVRADGIAAELQRSGWQRDALDVLTFAGRTALDLGLLDEARSRLAPAAAARDEGSSALRANAWLAGAALLLVEGDRAAAARALSTGMDIVEAQRSSLGSTELRAHASITGAELAELGLRLATENGDAVEVLRWAERWHAGGIQLTPVKPDAGSRLAEAIVELREAHAATIEGTAEPAETDARVAVLEREIRDLSRQTEATGADHRRPVDLASLRSRLGEHTFIEYFTIDDELHAVVATAESITTCLLGHMSDLDIDIRKCVSALGRLAFGSSSPTMAAATSTALRMTTDHLDRCLLGALPIPETGDLVVVPTGPLQGLPWAALGSLQHRPVTIAPSGTMWASGPRRRPSGDTERGRVVLVCGPRLRGGDAEIDQLRSLYDEPTVLQGSGATVGAVLAAMEHAELVHIAAHGVFRTDNPMFSALELSDGPLTVYDVESLASAPVTVVLPACDAGRSTVRRGDELLGTASALLQVGVRSVVAPVTVVPDASVVPQLMVQLHRRLQLGATPARALVEARRLVTPADAGSTGAVASAFVAIGART
ncbi:MAG: CHAT domain-containing protein [Acidimicrobiia bacterium]|nr:CHAT domain-containing protein [Acidimicrobiia bacterium]